MYLVLLLAIKRHNTNKVNKTILYRKVNNNNSFKVTRLVVTPWKIIIIIAFLLMCEFFLWFQPNAGQEHYENICMKAVNQSIGTSLIFRFVIFMFTLYGTSSATYPPCLQRRTRPRRIWMLQYFYLVVLYTSPKEASFLA